MSNKKSKLGVISAVAAGTGTAIYLAQKAKKESGNSIFKKSTIADSSVPNNYRNTERGKYDRNSKGIYYSNGNYEAFAHPEKPEGVDQKNAYIVGSGLASLAAACFLVRDAQMPGCQIHILEAMDLAGGACDGIYDTSRGYVMRGGREMENHFECLWDLFRSIPSIETPGVSVLDEYYWLNKHDPNYSLCRATVNRGKDAHTDGKFNLSQKGCMEIMKLFMTKDEDLYDKTIEDVFDEEVFDSTFFEKPLCFLGVIAFLSSKNLYVHFIFLASLYCQYLFIITLPYNTNKYSDMSHLSYEIHSVQFQSAQILISRTNDVREHYFLPLH